MRLKSKNQDCGFTICLVSIHEAVLADEVCDGGKTGAIQRADHWIVLQYNFYLNVPGRNVTSPVRRIKHCPRPWLRLTGALAV
jgi:hypothetical protein